MAIITFPRNGPYGEDRHVPVDNILQWYPLRDKSGTRVELKVGGSFETSLYPHQIDELFLKARE